MISGDPPNSNFVQNKQYVWHRTPSQIVYEVTEMPAYHADENLTQYDNVGELESYPQSNLGLLYMFIGITSLAAMTFLAKLAYSSDPLNPLDPLEVGYARFLGMILGNIAVSWYSGHTILEVSTGLEKNLLARALAGTISHLCYCYALLLIDCSIAITLNITNYFLSTITYMFQRHSITKLGIAITLTSIVGISILIFEIGYSSIVPLAGSLSMIISYFIVRKIKGEIYYTIPPTYLGVCGAIISSWGLLYQHTKNSEIFQNITMQGVIYLLLISITGWSSQIFQSWALQTEVSWRTSMMMYLIVFYGIIFDLATDYKKGFSYMEMLGILLLAGSNMLYTMFGY